MNFLDLLYLKFIPTETLLLLKIISGFISLIFILSIVFFLKNTDWIKLRYSSDIKDFFSFKPHETKRIEKAWNQIEKRLKSSLDSEYKLAILEADNLLNEVFEKMGYKGKTSGERLSKISSDLLPNVQDIVEVHKVRNDIIHDPDYRIDRQKAQEVVNIYEKALKDLYTL